MWYLLEVYTSIPLSICGFVFIGMAYHINLNHPQSHVNSLHVIMLFSPDICSEEKKIPTKKIT